MFKLSKKTIVGTLVLASVMLLGACGNNKEASKDKEVSLPSIEDRYTPDAKTPAWQLDTKKETTKLKWYVNADWWNTEYGKDMVTKKIKEDLNIDIEFITGDDTKLNT